MARQLEVYLAPYKGFRPYVAAALAVLLYAFTFRFGFVLDDQAVIEHNRFVHAGFDGIPKLLTTWYWEGYWHQNAGLYRPLSLILFAIEWAISPGNPLLHHVVQVGLYAVSLVQLYKLTARLTRTEDSWLPLLITLLFAVHPIHTEVVANIKSSDELLCFLFFTIGANDILKHRKVRLASCCCLLAALLSKESGLFYVTVFFLLLYQFCGMSFRAALKATLPYLAICLAWISWAAYVIYSAADPRVPYTYEDNSLLVCTGITSRFFTGLEILGRYMLKGFYPYQMSYDYSFNEVPCAGAFSLAGAAVLAASAFLIYFAIRQLKSHAAVAWGILFFFCTLLPVSNIFGQIGTTMADRFLYAPVYGLILAVVCGIRALSAGRVSGTLAATGAIAIVCFFSILTRTRAGAWASNLDLFRADADAAPHSSRTQYNYAAALLAQLPLDSNERRSALDEVAVRSKASLNIDPSRENAAVNLGAAQYQLGHYPEAVASFRQALQLAPEDSLIYLSLADAYVRGGQYDSARTLYDWCLKHGLRRPNTYNFYGMALFALARYGEAIETYRTGLGLSPADAELWRNYGSALATQKSFDAAIAAFNRANELNPDDRQTWYYLAITYQQLGNQELATTFMNKLNSK